MKVLDLIKEAASLGFYSAEPKSLRDNMVIGDTMTSSHGDVRASAVKVGNGFGRYTKKQNVKTLRIYAEFSSWVRAALDYYRDSVARAEYKLVPRDSTRPMNESIVTELTRLLTRPNEAEESYTTIKEMMLEDYLVLGHGAFEKAVRRNQAPYAFYPIDAARLNFVRTWDGSKPSDPRYVIVDGFGKPLRWLQDQYVFAMVNRPRSYDKLGLSHVEVLDLAVKALLSGDEYLYTQVMTARPEGLLNLGPNVGQTQVDQVRREIEETRKAFVIAGSIEDAEFIDFSPTERDMKLLDKQIWFVRQVAAVFQIPIAKLQVFAERTNRAGTQSQFTEMEEGMMSMLRRIEEHEDVQIVRKFGDPAKVNVRIDYPVLSRAAAKAQAEMSSGLQAAGIISMNEARRANGYDELNFQAAKVPLIPIPRSAPLPLDVYDTMMYAPEEPDQNADTEDGDEPATKNVRRFPVRTRAQLSA